MWLITGIFDQEGTNLSAYSLYCLLQARVTNIVSETKLLKPGTSYEWGRGVDCDLYSPGKIISRKEGTFRVEEVNIGRDFPLELRLTNQ